MDLIRSPRSLEDVGTSTNSDLINFNFEDFDMDDLQVCDNQKQPNATGARVAFYSNPIFSFGSVGSSGTANSATSSGTTSLSYCPSLLNNTVAMSAMGFMNSSECSSIDSTTQNNYISLTTPSTSTMSSSSSPSSDHSSSSGSASRPKRKRESLKHLTPDQKLNRKKEQNRLSAQSSRDRKNAEDSKLKLTLVQVRSENGQLHSQLATLRHELQQVKAKFELAQATLQRELEQAKSELQSTRSISNTYLDFDDFSRQMGHDDY